MTRDILQVHAYPWRTPETRALWAGIHRSGLSLASWYSALAELPTDRAGAEVRYRLERATFFVASGTVLLPLVALATTRVDCIQIAERIHIEHSRRHFWEGTR